MSAPLPLSANKGVVVLNAIIPAFGCTDETVAMSTEMHLTAAQYTEYKAKQEEKKAAFAASIATIRAKIAQKEGSSDRESEVRTFVNPGVKELKASLNSATSGWMDVSHDDLRFYLPSGVPPQDIATNTLAKYTDDARTAMNSTLDDPDIKSMLSMIPTSMRDKCITQLGIDSPTRYLSLIPCMWLQDKMRVLCVLKVFADKTNFIFERHAVQSSPEAQWLRAVQLHNGFCKTIIELQAFKLEDQNEGEHK